MEIISYADLKHQGKYRSKKQIVLTHTGRPINYYLTGVRNRHNGRYDKVPHYVIARDGKVFSLIDTDTYSNVLNVVSYNKRSIIISLENLGWLKKNPLKNNYINWIGDITNDDIYERKWRGHFFWQNYTEEQMNSLVELCNSLCEKYDIPLNCVGHNVKVDHIEKFSGISSKSNYDRICTALSPAFDFDLFIDKIDNNHE